MQSIAPLGILAFAAAILGGLGCDNESSPTGSPTTIVGTGNLVEEVRAVSDVRGVSLEIAGDLRARVGAKEALTVTAQGNLLPHIVTEVGGGVLRIRSETDVDLEPTITILVDLVVPTLESLTLAGVGNVDAAGLSGNSLSLLLTGVGEIDLASAAIEELEVVISGAGDVRVTGNVGTQSVTISGLGEYAARDLSSAETAAVISGVGSIGVQVKGRLTATITGTGTICYDGDPALDVTITGQGSVGPCGG